MSHKDEAEILLRTTMIDHLDPGEDLSVDEALMLIQAHATLALVEELEKANELKRIETIVGVLNFAVENDFEDAEWAMEVGKQITADGGFTLTPRIAAALGIGDAE